MNDDIPESLSKFGDKLEQAIRRQRGPAPALRRRLRSRPRLLAGTTVGVAALATTLALLFGAASSSPAFAVTRNNDGTVSVRLMRPAGLAGANAKLAKMNVRVKLVQVAASCHIWASRGPMGNFQGRGAQARIRPSQIPPGRTLVIGVRRDGRIVRVPRQLRAVATTPNCMAPIPLPCPLGAGRHRRFPARNMAAVAKQVPLRQIVAAPCKTGHHRALKPR